MFVKKFEAPTLEDAIHLIKNEFGPNALILSTNQKQTKWYEKPRVEVTAAMEKPEEKKEEKKTLPRDERILIDERKLVEIFPHRKDMLFDGYTSEAKPARSMRYVDIQSEEKPASRSTTPAYRKVAREKNENTVNETEYVEHFIRLGFLPDTAKEFSRRLSYDHAKADLKKEEFFNRIKAKLLQPQLKVMTKNELAEKKNLIFLGLPGVGKTTLLVKMGIWMKKEKNLFPKGFCFVSQDARRLAARQELLGYSKLLKSQCHLKFPERAEDGKFQLIDAPALSMNNDENKQLERLCDGRFSVLLLDGTQRVHEMLKVLDRSQRFLPRAIAFTRLDYVTETGALFEVLKTTNLPLFGSCNSSSFKKTLQTYTAETLSNYLVSGRGAAHE